MMRAMYSGVAGLKTHQTKMDVIGNNIANVNTVAYKSQSITFAELMYQTTQRASGPNANTGTAGRNARQIGLGVKSAAIGMAIETPGATQTTGNPFDLRITGNAFFIVNDGNNNYFTRDGSFYVDAVGNLAMSSNGYNVMGWQVDPENPSVIKKDTVSALRIMSPDNMTYPPEATSKGYVSGIIDSDDPQVHSESGRILNLSFFDNLGYVYTAKLSMKATGKDHVFTVELDKILDSNGNVVDFLDENGKSKLTFGSTQNVADPKTLTLSSAYTYNGTDKSITYTDDDGTQKTISLASNALTDEEKTRVANAYGFSSYEEFTKHYTGTNDRLEDTIDAGEFYELLDDEGNLNVNGKIITGGLIEYDASTGLLKSVNGLANNLSLTLSFGDQEITAGGPFSPIEIDFSASTNFGNNGVTTIGADPGDKAGLGTGRMVGELSEITIQQDGMIYASYDNGQTKLLGQIAVAEFPNPMGLEKRGDNLYGATLNSGEFDGIGVDITGNGGYMETGVLEMSNVDLSTEFTEMITAQRGFQANSRIITVSDTLLEELVNLKR